MENSGLHKVLPMCTDAICCFSLFFKKNLLYLPSDLICFIYLSSDLVQNTARLLKQKDTTFSTGFST